MATYEEQAKDFYSRLLDVVPEFRANFDDQVEYFEELLAVLMAAELARFLIATTSESTSTRRDAATICRRTCEFLDEELNRNDTNVEDWIYTGFCEGLLGESESVVAQIVDTFGPNLKRVWLKHFAKYFG